MPSLGRLINWGYFKLFSSQPHSNVDQSYKVGQFEICIYNKYTLSAQLQISLHKNKRPLSRSKNLMSAQGP